MEAAFTPTCNKAPRTVPPLAVLVALAGAAGVLLSSPVPGVLWFALAGCSLAAGLAAALLTGRRGTRIDARGIRTAGGHEPWEHVVDLRAERRGARTVVSVYLVSGASLQLAAPYSGDGLLAEDPQFELKVSTLSHLWRSHTLGGVPC